MTGGILLAVAVVAISALVVLYVFRTRGPYSGETRAARERSTTSEQYHESADRPAGPGAEPMDPTGLGGDQRPPE